MIRLESRTGNPEFLSECAYFYKGPSGAASVVQKISKEFRPKPTLKPFKLTADRYGCGCLGAAGYDHRYAADEIGRKRWQPIILIFGPSHIRPPRSTIDIAGSCKPWRNGAVTYL